MEVKGGSESQKKGKVSIDSFFSVSVIGQGSYAKVMLVKKKDTNRFFALKKLKKCKIEKKRQEDHVRMERDILATITDSSFIVKLYYTFQNEKNLYFVLEYCPGGELFNLLHKKRRLSEAQARFYAAQIVLALEHLHKHDIVYRDLKPENILITSNGYIKITDFGLSRMNMTHNDAKSICGTPEYLAPEILMKMGYGKAVDWWTLGNLLYEMMVGIPPFYTRNRRELFEKIKFTNPRYPNHLSSLSKNIIDSLLRKDPSKRLGAIKGVQEIKDHPFFAEIDWDHIGEQKYKPFFIPKISENFGLHNFDTEFTEMPIESLDSSSKNGPFKKFPGFTYTNEVMKEVSTEKSGESCDMVLKDLSLMTVSKEGAN